MLCITCGGDYVVGVIVPPCVIPFIAKQHASEIKMQLELFTGEFPNPFAQLNHLMYR